ncbi:MAG TPA: TetR family transcriptional regulator C-terminal domain-containing protein, partial [Chloroflexota bacterium]
ALARSARSPELNGQLAEHYNRQRDRVAAWIASSMGGTSLTPETRQLASLMIAVVDGLLIQTFIDPAGAPAGADLANALRPGRTVRPRE